MSKLDIPFLGGLLVAAIGVSLIFLPAGLIFGGLASATIAALVSAGDR